MLRHIYIPLVITLLLLVFPFTSSTPLEKRGLTCKDVKIQVTVSASNARLPPDVLTRGLLNILGSLVQFTFNLLVTDTWEIAGRYCEPEFENATRANTLQFLVHGATYTRDYWSGDAPLDASFPGTQYSWIDYASKQGYPTLSIDRLGNGLSDHPDPILVVQYPTQVETLHQILLKVKSSPTYLGRTFNKIIYVGHSYGSIVGNALIAKYPTDVNAIIFTGYSSNYALALPGVAASAVLLPASTLSPSRFPDYDAGYLQVSSQAGAQFLFFWPGGYDERIFSVDWAQRGTFSIGEAATAAFGFHTASQFTGATYIMTGQHDTIFCNPTGLNLQALAGNIQCTSGPVNFLAKARELTPNARSFDWFEVLDAGHCWNLHRSGYAGFGKAHEWMGWQGF